MYPSYYSNIARCAEQRMDLLWEDACAAAGNNWEPFHERRWREHITYMAMTDMAFKTWRRANDPHISFLNHG